LAFALTPLLIKISFPQSLTYYSQDLYVYLLLTVLISSLLLDPPKNTYIIIKNMSMAYAYFLERIIAQFPNLKLSTLSLNEGKENMSWDSITSLQS